MIYGDDDHYNDDDDDDGYGYDGDDGGDMVMISHDEPHFHLADV